MTITIPDSHEAKTLEVFRDAGHLGLVLNKDEKFVESIDLSLEEAVALKRAISAFIKQIEDF